MCFAFINCWESVDFSFWMLCYVEKLLEEKFLDIEKV